MDREPSHLIANVLHTTGTAGIVLCSCLLIAEPRVFSYEPRFDHLFLIFWVLCVVASAYLLQDPDTIRPRIGFILAAILGALMMATPVLCE